MKIKNLILFLYICWAAGPVPELLNAQQVPVFGSYMMQPELYNPGVHIRQGHTQVYVGHRTSWVGFEDAPSSQYLTGRTRLSGTRLTLGGMLSRDQAGLINSYRFGATMGYQLIRTSRHLFGTGISLGGINQSLDLGKVNVDDPQVSFSTANITRLDAGVGFWYMYKRPGYQVEASLMTFQLPQTAALGDTGQFAIANHLLATLGWKIKLGAQVSLQPLFMYRGLTTPYQQNGGRFDLGLRALFLQDRVWFGGSYRTGDAGITGSLGANIKERLGLIAHAEIQSQLGTSFEMGLSYTFGEISRDPLPKPVEELPPDAVSLSSVMSNKKWLESAASLEAKPPGFEAFPLVSRKDEIELSFRYEDEEDPYDLEQMAEVEAVLDHLVSTVITALQTPTMPELKGVDSVFLVTWLRESDLELAFGANIGYGGDWGPRIEANYMWNNQPKSRTIRKGLLDGEELAYLKLYAISRQIEKELGIPASRISIRMSSEVEMEPLRKTTVSLRLKK